MERSASAAASSLFSIFSQLVSRSLKEITAKSWVRGAPRRAAPLQAAVIDARNIPDLVPVLAAAAATVPGETRFTGAGRLRLKESDRLETTARTLNALGGRVTETEDGLIVTGVSRLRGGTVDAAGDHRIAMAAAVASVVCQGPVTVTGAQAVEKSYPTFWADLASLGKTVSTTGERNEDL